MIINLILLLVYSVNYRVNSEQTPNKIQLNTKFILRFV